MITDSPLHVAPLLKWGTVLSLVVACGCLFVTVRTQQVRKEQEIRSLRRQFAEETGAIQKVEANIKRNLAPRVLEARLQAYQSTLAPVTVEQTEELAPAMTAAR